MIQKRFKHNVGELKDVLLAVSGGMDSMCMAHLFLETCGASAFAIAHCNFNLRGEESDGDEAMVRAWADANGVRLHVSSFDTSGYAQECGMSIEMAARELRYRWFASLCREYGYSCVAVAHHAEDNAETLILNMVRGTGLRGMTGMKDVSDLPCTEEHVSAKLIRPMLGFSRKQIEGYVMRYGIPYRTDSTNLSVEYRRNRIRHEVLPALKTLNPSLTATLNREMAYFSSASDIVDEWCNTAASGIVSGHSGELVVSTSGLLSHKHWRYLLYHILEPYGFNSSTLGSLEGLLSSDRTISGKRFRSAMHELSVERDSLIVRPIEDEAETSDDELVVESEGVYSLDCQGFMVEVCPWTPDMPLVQPDGVQIFDASALKFPFTVRRWKEGDWMIPLGMRGKKKISDIFSDLKFDAASKKSALILEVAFEEAGRRVAALLWTRMDSRFKVGDKTNNIIRVTRL